MGSKIILNSHFIEDKPQTNVFVAFVLYGVRCHGKKLLFGKSVGKSMVAGVWKRIFIPDLYQILCDLGL